MKEYAAKPFLKWAGGKGQLLRQLELYYPQRLRQGEIKKYVEPFVGGGAVFFELAQRFEFEDIVLNDINKELMISYQVIRDNPDILITKLAALEKKYISKNKEQREEMFYEKREQYNRAKKSISFNKPSSKWYEVVSKMIFLNKTCFNGLYRLNSKEEFNVPFGDYVNPTICDKIILKSVSKTLQNVELTCCDFEQLTDYIDSDTFVYFDPPYRPISGTSSFTRYHRSPFNDDSQNRLANWYKKLHNEKKALLMLSNSDPTNINANDKFFINLYGEFSIEKVRASRAINSKASNRGAINELLILNEEQLNGVMENKQQTEAI